MKRVGSIGIVALVVGLVSSSYAKPSTPSPAPAPIPTSSAPKKASTGPVFYAPHAWNKTSTPTTQAAATIKCALKFTLVMSNNNSAYCRRDRIDVRTVPLICPEGSVLMTEDKIPASAKNFALNDLCYKTGTPATDKSSYTFPHCGTDRTGSFPLNAQPGPDLCEKRLADFVAIAPGTPDPGTTQEGIATDTRINDAKVWCDVGTGDPLKQDGDGVYCQHN